MVGFIIYSTLVLAVGFFGGLMAKHIIDRDAIRSANKNFKLLRSENAYLRKIQQGKVIEIVDHNAETSEVKFGGF